jgi:hypothetical protein
MPMRAAHSFLVNAAFTPNCIEAPDEGILLWASCPSLSG